MLEINGIIPNKVYPVEECPVAQFHNMVTGIFPSTGFLMPAAFYGFRITVLAMKLRRRYITEIRGNRTMQKCLAISLILKTKLKKSRIHQYTINKLCQLAGISHKTAEKYEAWMIEYGYAHFEGTKDNRVFIINSVASHTSNRNIDISIMDLSSFQAAYRSLQSFIFMRIQHNKDFLQHLLQSRHDPESPSEFRAAKRKVKDLVEQGKLKSLDVHYEEFGLSLKRIAKEVGCCIRTVQRVIDYAVHKQWVERHYNFEWVYAPHVNHREVPGYTFSTQHKLCIAHANTYLLAPAVTEGLSY